MSHNYFNSNYLIKNILIQAMDRLKNKEASEQRNFFRATKGYCNSSLKRFRVDHSEESRLESFDSSHFVFEGQARCLCRLFSLNFIYLHLQLSKKTTICFCEGILYFQIY